MLNNRIVEESWQRSSGQPSQKDLLCGPLKKRSLTPLSSPCSSFPPGHSSIHGNFICFCGLLNLLNLPFLRPLPVAHHLLIERQGRFSHSLVIPLLQWTFGDHTFLEILGEDPRCKCPDEPGRSPQWTKWPPQDISLWGLGEPVTAAKGLLLCSCEKSRPYIARYSSASWTAKHADFTRHHSTLRSWQLL